MIVTVTPNPSLDRTVEVGELTRGAVLRARSQQLDPGGKGVNVARALAAHGHDVTAVVALGGFDGDQVAALLDAAGLPHTTVPVGGVTRSNLAVVEPDGTTTKINTAGPELDGDEVAALQTATLAAADGAEWVVCCGSLPPGAPEDLYARLTQRARAAGLRVAVDASGPALRAALAAAPDVIKPNREELAEATGREIDTLGDAVAAAQQLRRDGVGAVLVSLGADGAVLVGDDGQPVHGTCPVAAVRSTVGSGDALLSGFLAAGARGSAALAGGLAWAAAATELPGTSVPAPPHVDLDRVRLSAAVPTDLALAAS